MKKPISSDRKLSTHIAHFGIFLGTIACLVRVGYALFVLGCPLWPADNSFVADHRRCNAVQNVLDNLVQMSPLLTQDASLSAKKALRKKFGGRLNKKPQEQTYDMYDWATRAFEKMVFVYKRFSTREQKLKNAYSRERQDRLAMQAVQQGAQSGLSADEIRRVTSAPDYPGWYQNGQIVVEERDLVGVSGTKGQEERPGFAHMIRLIERNLISAIYVVDVTRLFRDQYLINATQFVKLCAERAVFVVTESMIFDMSNEMHRDMFLQQAQYASRELKMIMSRLGGSRRAKAEMAKYAGGTVAVGYVVLYDERSGRLNDYAVYEPHAKIVRAVFAKMLELRRLQVVAQWFNQHSILFPPFEPQYGHMSTRSALRNFRAVYGPDNKLLGYRILRSTVSYILDNPIYCGQFWHEGRLIKDDPSLAIIDKETFDAVQAILDQNTPRTHSGSNSQLLAGLLYCIAHDADRYVVYSGGRTYKCNYERDSGLAQKPCFIAAADILDVPVSQAVLGILSYSERSDQIITQLEQELADRQNRSRTYKRELVRLRSERDSLYESLAFLQQEETDPQKRRNRMQQISKMLDQRETQLQQLASEELAPFENVLTTTEISMVREFLSNLGTRWDEIPADMRNSFLRVILRHILIEEKGEHYSGPIKLDTETGRLKVYNYGHAQTIYDHL